jgi:hypothetical protein
MVSLHVAPFKICDGMSIIGIPDVISYDVTCVLLNVVNLVDILNIFI